MPEQEILNLVEASIRDLKHALDTGILTSVELASLYLHRIGKYDTRGPSLNSVCVLNPRVFEEAQASDDRRASGLPPRPLEGIPFTVKDSFSVAGMTVAAGSPAFADLTASSDAAIVQLLRAAGAVVLGRTNMPAMADGGAQRGLYGRAESPYNREFSTTAYASGSSSGCGTATAASFGAFGLAGETVSSGRSPAANNALVGYSPSRGVVPGRGQWPLYPTCDVIVPHTRSVADLLDVLNVVVAEDPAGVRDADFWRAQPFVPIPPVSEVRPANFHDLEDPRALEGKRIAVPLCFLGAPGAGPATVCTPSVRALWEQARADLEALGATVVETESFPVSEQYAKKDFPGQSANVPGMPDGWMDTERCAMIALAWDDFLRVNGDAKCSSLVGVRPGQIKPLVAPMDDPKQHSEAQNQVRYEEMIDAVRRRGNVTLTSLPGCELALKALEAMRKRELEDWMDANQFDLMAFPTQGDVAPADADELRESMLLALRDGVKYANGGRALKHLGVPCVTLPMGTTDDKGMPAGLTLCARAWKDADLLRCAYAYESATRRRTSPPLTPPLPSDRVAIGESGTLLGTHRPVLTVRETKWGTERRGGESELMRDVHVAGTVGSSDASVRIESIRVLANGELVEGLTTDGDSWSWSASVTRPRRDERFPTIAVVPKDQYMVVIVAKASNGRCAASLILG